MYESPIVQITKGFHTEIDNGILKAVMEHGIIVDKEELLKALKYDRGQYDKGYKDGYKAGIKRLCDISGCSSDYILFGKSTKNDGINNELAYMLKDFSDSQIEETCEIIKNIAIFMKNSN